MECNISNYYINIISLRQNKCQKDGVFLHVDHNFFFLRLPFLYCSLILIEPFLKGLLFLFDRIFLQNVRACNSSNTLIVNSLKLCTLAILPYRDLDIHYISSLIEPFLKVLILPSFDWEDFIPSDICTDKSSYIVNCH